MTGQSRGLHRSRKARLVDQRSSVMQGIKQRQANGHDVGRLCKNGPLVKDDVMWWRTSAETRTFSERFEVGNAVPKTPSQHAGPLVALLMHLQAAIAKARNVYRT